MFCDRRLDGPEDVLCGCEEEKAVIEHERRIADCFKDSKPTLEDVLTFVCGQEGCPICDRDDSLTSW